MKFIPCFIFLVSAICVGQGAKLLVVFPFHARSHHALGNALVRILVEAGNDVTFISPFEEKNKPKSKGAGTWTDVLLDPPSESTNSKPKNLSI